MVSTPPKFVWTRTPAVYPPGLGGGGGSDAALEAERHRPGTCTDRTFFDRPAFGIPDGGEHVLPRDVASPDVVQVPVVRLADQRVDGLDILVSPQDQHVVDERVGHTRDAQGGCEQDWGLDFAKFVHLGGASQLAEGVAHENRAGYLL